MQLIFRRKNIALREHRNKCQSLFFFIGGDLHLLAFSVLLVMSDPMDCSPPDSSVHGISQARILEWVAISFSRRSSWPRDRTCVSFGPCINRGIPHRTTWEAPDVMSTLHWIRDFRGTILTGKHGDWSLQRVAVKYFTLILVRKQSFCESQIRALRTPASLLRERFQVL